MNTNYLAQFNLTPEFRLKRVSALQLHQTVIRARWKFDGRKFILNGNCIVCDLFLFFPGDCACICKRIIWVLNVLACETWISIAAVRLTVGFLLSKTLVAAMATLVLLSGLFELSAFSGENGLKIQRIFLFCCQHESFYLEIFC